MPGVVDVPNSEYEQLLWAENLVKKLKYSELKQHFFFAEQDYGYMITVVEMDGMFYLIHSIRNEFKSYNNVIYINNKNLDDLVNIGKMMQDNIKTIMQDYKDNMLALRNDIIAGKVRLKDDGKVNKA